MKYNYIILKYIIANIKKKKKTQFLFTVFSPFFIIFLTFILFFDKKWIRCRHVENDKWQLEKLKIWLKRMVQWWGFPSVVAVKVILIHSIISLLVHYSQVLTVFAVVAVVSTGAFVLKFCNWKLMGGL